MVTLDAGISISWAPDPDGSYEHGTRHHRDEEDEFRARIDAASAAIEVLFDAWEMAGRRFESPTDAQFGARAQRHDVGDFPRCTLELWCTPALSEAELAALTGEVAALVSAAKVPDAAPEPEAPAAPAPPTGEPARPWWRFW